MSSTIECDVPWNVECDPVIGLHILSLLDGAALRTVAETDANEGELVSIVQSKEVPRVQIDDVDNGNNEDTTAHKGVHFTIGSTVVVDLRCDGPIRLAIDVQLGVSKLHADNVVAVLVPGVDGVNVASIPAHEMPLAYLLSNPHLHMLLQCISLMLDADSDYKEETYPHSKLALPHN